MNRRVGNPQTGCWLGVVLWLASCVAVTAAEPSAAGVEFFEKKIRPLLAERCFECHSQESAESELQLDSLAGLLRGGMRGPAIVVGQPERSLLVSAIRHGEILKMPPKTKLPPAQIADLVAWIKMGAPWPAAQAVAAPATPPGDEPGESAWGEAERSFWSFRPPTAPPLPDERASDWVQSPIDAFILARLRAAGFEPAAPADKRTLLRRATFDLTGLPPSEAELRAFLADDSPQAWARVVDRLLHSPRYGERWGRHWLDVARYADSNGLDENLAFANAFRYRDYVVAAFNKDKPFDRFVQEQLAGDLLPAGQRPADTIEALVATGWLSLGAKMLAEDDPVKMEMDIIDEQVDTLGRAFMGLTLGCARCHDHKFDPLSTADYYALAGIFKSTTTMENFKVVARWQERPLALPEAVAARQRQQARVDAAQAAIDKLTGEATDALLQQARGHVGDYLLAAWRRGRLDQLLAAAAVHGNDPDVAARPDAVLIEAEDYQRGNVTKDRSAYGKGIGVLVNRGEVPNVVEYDVDVPRAGVYQLEIRLAAAASRPCALSINGHLVKSDAAARVTGSWYPDTQTWGVEGFYQLAAGKNVLRLEHPQYFPHIDKLLLVHAPQADAPAAAGEAPAEAFQPLPEFVQQWSAYLGGDDHDPADPFAAWRAAVQGRPRGALPAATQQVLADLEAGGDPQQPGSLNRQHYPDAPAELVELAQRYQARCARVVPQVTPSDGAAPAEQLDDPLDEALRSVLFGEQGPFAVFPNIEAHFPEGTRTQLAARGAEKQQLEKALPSFPEAMAVADGTPQDLRVHIRGSHLSQGRLVPRRFPQLLHDDPAPLDPQHSGRLELARWMTRADHPLTARVIVNRVWLWHFGEGLVRSPDNFGHLGQPPTHPQLLDWLAVQFVRSGWSIKQLHRTIMLSSTYQMSTAHNEQAAAVDPENRLWWRFNRRRLRAEAVRDALLAASGQLDLSMGGSLLPTKNRAYVTSTANIDPVVYETNRRSLYLPVVRSALYDVFQAFDFAEPSVSSGSRQTTTVAPQALFMMNSKFVTAQTAALAERLLAQQELDDAARVRWAYRRVLGRAATDGEVARAVAFVSEYAAVAARLGHDAAAARRGGWEGLCRALVSSNEFIYVE